MKKLLALLLLSVIFAVPAQASFKSYVETAIADGVILGDPNGNIDENKPVTRGEFAVILARFLNLSGGINTFADVSPHNWFTNAIVAANHHSIMMGDENGNARPYDNIRREDAITMIGRYYGAKNQDVSLAKGVSDYAREYWAYAVSNGLLSATDPNEYISKGETLQLLYEYDTTDGASVRFLPGYPKLSQNLGKFGHISIDVRTNKACKLYFAIVDENQPHADVNNYLCDTTKELSTVSIKAKIGKSYDIYFLAVDADGVTSKIYSIKKVRPFTIALGNGSRSAPFIINTEEQLEQISVIPNKFFRLGSDVVIKNDNWSPIPEFSGTLDGNGHTIKGLRVHNKNHAGLFSLVSGTIKNLTVYAEISAGKVAGVIAGENEGIIENCSALGTVSANTDYAGGICGLNYGTIRNCLTSLYSVTAGSFSGGICGANYGFLQNNLAATNVVASDMYAGGIAGLNSGGTINTCVSACMTVHDVLTQNSGRITTNKKGGKLYNNYFYLEAISDAIYEEPSDHSQNGYDASWENLRDLRFYKKLGWNTITWKLAKNGYRLIYPKSTSAPVLNPGETIYFPKPIKTATELRAINDNDSGHYILAEDIHVSEPWKTICTTNGFSGTFDGDGHTIHDLNLNTQAGFFSNITGGTVKNLTLKNVTSSSDTVSGILTACNYGYIDNCKIYGKIKTRKAGHIGTFAGLNHGAITNCEAYVDITNTYSNSTVGGICAESDGVIFGVTYRGKITVDSENTVVGGICGYDTGGYISDSFAYMILSAKTSSGYIGGVCGMAEGSQIYKCASGGNIVTESSGTIYAGGICALSQSATLYNCFSLSEIHSFAQNGYIGGICGCNSGSNVQNTYSAGNILSAGSIFAGGICGYVENGFVMQNVALNPAINGGENIGAIYGKEEMSGITDNFSCQRTLINSQHITDSVRNGIIKNPDVFKNSDFFYKPIASGGLIGWPNTYHGENVWENSNSNYPFPVLSGVDSMGLITTPRYN